LKSRTRAVASVGGADETGHAVVPLRFDWDPEVVALLVEKQQAMAMVVAERTECVVQAGPFEGLRYLDEVSWGDLGSKLLGFYEEELHSAITRWSDRDYDVIVDVGCAEGYYAAGLGLRFPDARIVAIDIDSRARAVCAGVLEQNGQSERAEIHGESDPASISAMLEPFDRPLLFVDCEGYEAIFLDPEAIPALDRCDIIVECHDFVDREITATLMRRFDKSHAIERIDEQARDPWKSPWLSSLGALDAALFVCEFRPEPMHWLVLESRRPARA